jgi:hypothetical protein
MATWNISGTFGIFYDHLVHFEFVWYIFSGFGIVYQEKSGNPVNSRYLRTINISNICCRILFTVERVPAESLGDLLVHV